MDLGETVEPDGNIHVMPGWEEWHIERASCPCHPFLEFDEGQKQVWVHREKIELS